MSAKAAAKKDTKKAEPKAAAPAPKAAAAATPAPKAEKKAPVEAKKVEAAKPAAAAAPAKAATPAPAAAPKAAEKKAAPVAATAEKKAATDDEKLAKKKAAKKAAGKAKLQQVKAKKFTIDCTEPVEDDIFDIASFEKFLNDRVKVGGKTGVLGDNVTIVREANVISITAKIAFSKRYLKYLTKKFLKKQTLRDYIRVIAKTKTGYFLRYFNFHNEDAEEETDKKA